VVKVFLNRLKEEGECGGNRGQEGRVVKKVLEVEISPSFNCTRVGV